MTLLKCFDDLSYNYYERRLLEVAHNRMDSYISLRHKGIGAAKVNQDSIHESTIAGHVYLIKSTVYMDKEYEVDTQKWTCTCTVGRTGYPSGEPCKHQHAVAKKFYMTAPNLFPYFNGEGRYLHALITLVQDRVGDKSFYAGMKEMIPLISLQGSTPIDSTEMQDDANRGEQISDVLEDEGAQNIDLMLSVISLNIIF